MADLLDVLYGDKDNKTFGKFRAIVKNIQDPEKLGRIKVSCPDIYGNDLSPWAWPCASYGGFDQTGIFMLPEIESGVWLEFEQGCITNPIWSGCWWTKPSNKNEVPLESISNYGSVKTIKTKKGHLIILDDTDSNEKIIIKNGKSGVAISLIGDSIFLGDGSIGVARIGDEIEVDIGGTKYNGVIKTGSSIVKI